ncbi:MAG TPA: DUF2268 domain-containing putative Zn-dependent protease [Chthoniobacterales bacterium]
MQRSRQFQKAGRLSRYLLIFLTCGYPWLNSSAANTLLVYDLIPELFNFLRIAPEEKEDRAKLFAQSIIELHPEIYDRPQTFKTDTAALEQYLNGLPAFIPAIKQIHARFQEQYEPILTMFLKAFPDFDCSRARVYLMLSLFRFDGKIPYDNPHVLFLGLDGLAKFHGADTRWSVILTHELFHLYHFQVNPLPRNIDDVELYRLVWQEGLATYVSKQLNPDASLADVLLDPRLAQEGPRYLPAVARDLVRQLEAMDDSTTARYLSYWRGGQIPARMGYLIGYEIARKSAATKSVRELARLRGQPLLNLVRQQMQVLATGGSEN